jgi:predicted nucleotidyltransferase
MSKRELRNLENLEAGYRNDIEVYCARIWERYGSRFLGALLFGSLVRGQARPYETLESDIDLIVLIEGLPPLSQRIVEKIEVERNLHTLVRAIWMTPEDLEGHLKAKAGYVLDAFDEGILLYDQDGFLSESRRKLVEELREKGVVKTDRWWSFPVKAGEEYTY